MTEDYAGLNTNEARHDAIQNATDVAQLDAMWAAWEAKGMSRKGLTYAAVLERKGELGHELSEEERTIIREADEAWKRGKDLAPITGRQGPGTV